MEDEVAYSPLAVSAVSSVVSYIFNKEDENGPPRFPSLGFKIIFNVLPSSFRYVYLWEG